MKSIRSIETDRARCFGHQNGHWPFPSGSGTVTVRYRRPPDMSRVAICSLRFLPDAPATLQPGIGSHGGTLRPAAIHFVSEEKLGEGVRGGQEVKTIKYLSHNQIPPKHTPRTTTTNQGQLDWRHVLPHWSMLPANGDRQQKLIRLWWPGGGAGPHGYLRSTL